MKYYKVRHKGLNSYVDRPKKCLLCTGPHQTSNYQCEIDKYSKKPRKLYMYIVTQYVNCINKY